MLVFALLLGTATALPAAQEPQEPAADAPDDTQEDPQLARAWERWEQFTPEDHAFMLASIEDYIFAGEAPRLRRFAELRADPEPPETLQKAGPWRYDADTYAPALGLRSKVIDRDSRAWKSFAARYRIDPEARPEAQWRWSAGRQALLAPSGPKPITAKARIQAYLTGRLPEPDYWMARVESELGGTPEFQQAAAYFEHEYRDRDGAFYEGIRLADMWTSQREFGISDVEAVAYLREILQDDTIRSPIPGSLHDGIYALIRDEFASYREAQELRRALAVVYVDPEGPVPPVLRSVAPRFELAWALVDHHPATMATWLARHADRKSFLASVEEAIGQALATPGVTEDSLRLQTQAWRAHLPLRAREALHREGLLGVRGR